MRDYETTTARIRLLNDAFRANGFNEGALLLSPEIGSLLEETRLQAFLEVVMFDKFDADDKLHDHGAFDLDGRRFVWRIHYLARSLDAFANDPADENSAVRLLALTTMRRQADA